jgi:hypothetical protein
VFELLFIYVVFDYAKCVKGERDIEVVTGNRDKG